MKIPFTKSLLCLGCVLLAETSFTQSNPLSVGDMLPPSLLQSLTTYQKPVAENQQLTTTNQQPAIGNQFLILDFWATWCTACLKGFDKLKVLQQQFPQLQVLLINAASTGDTKEKIKAFTAKRFPAGLPFPSLVNDTIFKQLFPYELLPHYVWLHQGRVAAITGADELTAENIQKVLGSGTAQTIQQKTDQDAAWPLFASPSLPIDAVQQYAVCSKGKYPGLGSGNHIRRTGNIVHGHAITNKPLLYHFRMIANNLIPGFNDKRWLLTEADSALLFPPSVPGGKEQWEKQNLFTTDYIVPPGQADSLYPFMLSFLNKATGWHGEPVTKTLPVFLLQASASFAESKATGQFINKLHNKKDPYMQNGSISNLLDWCNQQPWLPLPVITNINTDQKITLQLPPGISTVEALNKALQPYGLFITQQLQPITMFSLTRSQNSNTH